MKLRPPPNWSEITGRKVFVKLVSYALRKRQVFNYMIGNMQTTSAVCEKLELP